MLRRPTGLSGNTCLANRCARNRSLDGRYTFVTAVYRWAW
jgi:hypothetical protein